MRATLWFVLVLAGAVGLWGLRPPAALGPDALPEEFSAARAIVQLSHFATRPHPIGSPKNARVREYLVATLDGLGLTVQVEETTARLTKVRNIVATLPGTAHQRAVMLVAHYDSVPEGPGAADDGAGVISILETIRALRAGPPLPNDLVVLLTDGEEAGLLGAAGYVAGHPELGRRVGVVVNMEARGSSGPALMFETSEQNGWLIREFARAAPCPVASSLAHAIYRLMPNDTDLTELKKSGVGALNFAFTGTVRDYHTAADDIAHLDPRSVQQMGMNTLALARHFGALPLTKVRAPDVIFFNWIGCWLIVYPVWVGWILVVATFLLLFVAFRRGRRNLRLSLVSLAAFFLLLLVVGGAIGLAGAGLGLVNAKSLGQGDTTGNLFCFIALAGIGFGLGLATLRWLSGKLGATNLAGGMLLVLSLLGAVVLWLLPGGSYVVQLPALLGAAGLLLGWRGSWGLLAALPVTILLAPLAYLFFVNLGLNAVSLGATALLVCLLLATAWPLFDFLLPVAGKNT
ncbi:MAG: M20/M25/M40 family metallo-hydrolase [Chthoniobacterales bacterium]